MKVVYFFQGNRVTLHLRIYVPYCDYLPVSIIIYIEGRYCKQTLITFMIFQCVCKCAFFCEKAEKHLWYTSAVPSVCIFIIVLYLLDSHVSERNCSRPCCLLYSDISVAPAAPLTFSWCQINLDLASCHIHLGTHI